MARTQQLAREPGQIWGWRLAAAAQAAALEPHAGPPRAAGQKLRCVGTALSPNGIAFCPEGMVSLANMDRILAVDTEARTGEPAGRLAGCNPVVDGGA